MRRAVCLFVLCVVVQTTSLQALAEEGGSGASSTATAGFVVGVVPPIPPIITEPESPEGNKPHPGRPVPELPSWILDPDMGEGDHVIAIPEETIPGGAGTKGDQIKQETGGTGASGLLRFDYVTTLRFALADVQKNENSMLISGVQNLPNLQVSDHRGNQTGWKVTVSAGQFLDRTGEPVQGMLILYNARIFSPVANVASPITQSQVCLPLNGSATCLVAQAEEGGGAGIWVNLWSQKNGQSPVELLVYKPSTRILQGEIIWSLFDAP